MRFGRCSRVWSQRCMKEGLVGGEGFAVDASVIKADANRSRSTAREGAEDLRDPRHATRAVREYLAALDEQGEPVTVPASISPTDPAARWTAVDGPAFYAYSTNYLIDVQAGIIVDVEATPTLRTAEVKATRTMIERVEERFDLKPERLIGDMAYGNAELLGWMVNDKGIEPHVPVWDRTQRDDGTLSSSDFEWDEQADEYRCPQGQPLRSEWRIFKQPANAHHQSQHHHLSRQPGRLQQVPDEGTLLSEHSESEDRSQRP